MKRKTLALLFGLVLSIGLTACGGGTAPAEDSGSEQEAAQTETKTEEPAQTETKTEESEENGTGLPAEGDVGDYYVVLKDCAFTTDYEGNKTVVVTYDFTNNSEEAISAIAALYIQAFQDGIELETAFVMDDSAYNAETSMKDIKPGVTLEDCQDVFVLTSDSPIEIEVSELFGDPAVGQIYDVQ